jgi:hypothetical protein
LLATNALINLNFYLPLYFRHTLLRVTSENAARSKEEIGFLLYTERIVAAKGIAGKITTPLPLAFKINIKNEI